MKYYAVVKGRKTGIFEEWYGKNGAKIQVSGYSGALFRGFKSLIMAEDWFMDFSKKNSVTHKKDKRKNSINETTVKTEEKKRKQYFNMHGWQLRAESGERIKGRVR
ncbi:MAG: hypothetical protein DDT19_00652 [Syntrophomonadaceae bacterium]|nr:hypothetical protein [Bacillota bacterium]